MADGPLENVVRELRRIAGLTEAAGLADGRLLEVFSATSEPAALEVLVRRYGPMVFGVCRRVLRHTQDAEDAFQATFLVLVRKAAGLRRGETLGNWLYGVAYRTALQARTRSARRRRLEAETPPMDTENSALESAAQLETQALLDRELNRLPEKFRSPIILCDLLGKTLKQASVELHCPEGTVSSRLARGRERLKKQLEHHAPTLAEGSAPLMAIGPSMIQSLPAGLCMNTVKAAVLIANGTTMASLSPSVAAIVQEVMKSMLITKLKPTVMLFVGFGLLSGMTFVVASGMGIGNGPGDVADKGKVEKPAPAVVVAEREAPVVAEVQPPPKVQEKQKKRLLYDGKDFNAWLDVLQNELKPEVRVDAIKALGAFGVNGYAAEATAGILEEMRKHDVPAKGPNNVLQTGRNVLLQIGDVALKALVEELKSNNANDRRLAVYGLELFSIESSERHLLSALHDDDKWVRASAVTTLSNKIIGRTWKLSTDLSDEDKKALVATLAAIGSSSEYNSDSRQRAYSLLAVLEPYNKAALPVLIKALEEDDKGTQHLRVRQQAAVEIGRLGPFAKDAVPALIRVLEDLSNQSKQAITKGKKVADPSKKTSGGPPVDQDFRISIIVALGYIGSEAKETVPALIATLNDDNSAVAKSAKAALIKVGPGAVPQLVAALKSKPDDRIRNQIVEILGEYGPAAVEAVPLLIVELNNDDDQSGLIWALAARALGKIGPGAKDAVPAIASRMQKDSLPARQLTMLEALKQIGPPPDQVVPALVKVLKLEMLEDRQQRPQRIELILESINYLGTMKLDSKLADTSFAIAALRNIQEAPSNQYVSSTDLRKLKEAAASALEKIQK